MSTPKLITIKTYFAKAKTVKCLRTGLVVDVTNNDKYELSKDGKIYTSVGGAVTFWSNGNYAEIVSEKESVKN